jgi:thymidylate kinase
VARLGVALASRGVCYCQWKGHGKRERWESGRGDIDLLVDRASWTDFADVLAGLGFKLALPPPGREAAGIVHYFGLDERTGKMIHVHAYQRLVIGSPWRTHYRIPLERALLDSAAQQAGAVFKTAAPELEILVLVLRLSLRHALTDPLRRAPPRWLDGALPELDRLEEQVSPDVVAAALAKYLPEVSLRLFERCRDALRLDGSARRRLAVRLAVSYCLAAHAARPPVLALAERVLSRLFPLGQRLAGGGSVVALLGGDGSGKSTCADALDAWLGSDLATVHVHLGKPPRSLTTFVAGGALKLAQRLGAPRHVAAHLELLRHVCTARDRYRVYRRARRFATAGGIAICERYPTPEGWALAGPSDVQGLAPEATSTLAARLRQWERRYYERMTSPDVVFLLQVDPDTAVSRKTNEPAAYVRERAQLTWDTDWSRSGARIVDAAQPLPQVLSTLKAELWGTL